MKIIILNFSTAEVIIGTLLKNEEAEDYLIRKNLKESECQWMITDTLIINTWNND